MFQGFQGFSLFSGSFRVLGLRVQGSGFTVWVQGKWFLMRVVLDENECGV